MTHEYVNPATIIESDPARAKQMFQDFYAREMATREQQLTEKGTPRSALLIVNHYLSEAESLALGLGVTIPPADQQIAWAQGIKPQNTDDETIAGTYIMTRSTITARRLLSELKSSVAVDDHGLVDAYETTARKRASFEAAPDDPAVIQALYDRHVRVG